MEATVLETATPKLTKAECLARKLEPAKPAQLSQVLGGEVEFCDVGW
jgi:hypothetical protein